MRRMIRRRRKRRRRRRVARHAASALPARGRASPRGAARHRVGSPSAAGRSRRRRLRAASLREGCHRALSRWARAGSRSAPHSRTRAPPSPPPPPPTPPPHPPPPLVSQVRCLDAEVPPLLTAEVVRKACGLAAKEPCEAARLLRVMDHASIKAFCKAACRELAISQPQVLPSSYDSAHPGVSSLYPRIPTSQGARLEGGCALSPADQRKLKARTVSVDTDLPGRLLVVRAGTAVCEETGQPLCPPALVDRVFASAAELHAELGARLATCDGGRFDDAARRSAR